MGELFWKEVPSDAAIQAMGTKRGESAEGLGQILTWFNQAGAQVIEMIIASKENWDRYEAPKWRTFDCWKLQNPGDPEFETLVEYTEKSQANYLNYERPHCDWGVFVLRLEDRYPALSIIPRERLLREAVFLLQVMMFDVWPGLPDS